MSNNDDDPVSWPRVLRSLDDRGGVAKLVAYLLTFGVDEHGDWDAERLNRHLGFLGDREALQHSTDILKVAVDEPEFDTATMALIDAVLETLDTRDAEPIVTWVALHEEVLR